jgi:hypothetical protein
MIISIYPIVMEEMLKAEVNEKREEKPSNVGVFVLFVYYSY